MDHTLIVDEETRTEYVRYRSVRDMLNLGEELPSEVIIWIFGHSNPLKRCRPLMLVAFEKSQFVALAYSEVVVSSLVIWLPETTDKR